ncbi:co-chaperone GroES [Candidatus Bipolaricaulota bacterium]|nr:co-chaperone GroES [Candidatus Bipolaricaulota bacterium]TFH11597.1 MAG: co-chaperone GroES [Candidatus Atribacteria bacterium]
MTIKPLGKRILAKKLESETKKTAGGIVLPNTVQSEKVVRAKVLAIGTDEKFEVKVGDEIIVGTFAGTEIEQGEDKLILVKETDVLAIVEN